MQSTRKIGISALVCVLVGSAHAGSADVGTVRYVDDDAPPGGDGTSWLTPYRHLTDALFDLTNVAEIRIAGGLYRPDRDESHPLGTGDRTATFAVRDGIRLVGGYAGFGAPDPEARDVDQYPTLLSGDLAGDDEPEFVNYADNSLHVVTATGADAVATLDGLTIASGHEDEPGNEANGAGVRLEGGSLVFMQCTVRDNLAIDSGGGIFALDAKGLRLDGCTFSGNRTTDEYGGAVAAIRCPLETAGCTFIDNRSRSGGGAIRLFGTTTTITGCRFERSYSDSSAGAVLSSATDTIVEDCVFTDNSSTGTGGLSGSGGGTVAVRRCVFTGNVSRNGAGALSLGGTETECVDCDFFGNSSTLDGPGAVSVTANDPARVERCTFDGNTAFARGGALATGIRTTVADCLFMNNVANEGGAIDAGAVTPVITGCEIIGNEATFQGGGVLLGLIADVAITNCRIAGNRAAHGAGLCVQAGGHRVANCTVFANVAEGSGGGIYKSNTGTSLIVNCILRENVQGEGDVGESAQIFVQTGAVNLAYSSVQGLTGGFGGVGNIGDDPLFADPTGPDGEPGTLDDDLRLASGSPCVDAGNNWGVPPDAADLDGDADESELTPHDLDGEPRFADAPEADTGCGLPVVADMGAYESGGTPVNPVRLGDIDASGRVAFNDLIELLTAWGPCVPGCCLADLDLSGDVAFADLLLLLANWS